LMSSGPGRRRRRSRWDLEPPSRFACSSPRMKEILGQNSYHRWNPKWIKKCWVGPIES
jgi:hypothetical protein